MATLIALMGKATVDDIERLGGIRQVAPGAGDLLNGRIRKAVI